MFQKRVWYGTVMGEKGQIAKRGKFNNDPQELDEFLERIDDPLALPKVGEGTDTFSGK